MDGVLIELKKVFENCPTVESAMLFGSRARKDNKERSDYDVAVFGAVSSEDKITIFSGVENLKTLLKIDLVFYNEVGAEKFKENILNEGVVFYDGKIRK